VRVEVLEVDSAALRGNPLGDPARRKLPLIVPSDLAAGEPVPCLWWLVGFGGVGASMLAHDPWQEGLPERLARLSAEGKIGKMIVALPDGFTRFGGSQYLRSSAQGDYETYLVDDLRAAVEARYTISAHGIGGKSSGGFGALVHGMRHPGRYRAVAASSPDLGFGFCYHAEILALASAIDAHGGLEQLVAAFEATRKKREGRWFGPISALAMAAAYSPDPSRPLGIAPPFDLAKGDLDPEVLARWRAWDPLELIEDVRYQAALRSMRLVFLECGRRDEHHLHFGARALSKKLAEFRVPHEYDEFDDGHRNTGYRLDGLLPRVFRALAAEGSTG
jgi:S-formylglutathione hydrolase FrmB